MKTFKFRIQEESKYWQVGTISVEAETEEEARKLAEAGQYDHEGDNEILLDTETVLNTKITDLIQ